jgi:hypothetical protein
VPKFVLNLTVMLQSFKFDKGILFCILQRHPDARIQEPTTAEVLSYITAISSQYHHAPDFWAACDGLKLTMQASLDDITQNVFCNGCTHGHYIAELHLCICS